MSISEAYSVVIHSRRVFIFLIFACLFCMLFYFISSLSTESIHSSFKNSLFIVGVGGSQNTTDSSTNLQSTCKWVAPFSKKDFLSYYPCQPFLNKRSKSSKVNREFNLEQGLKNVPRSALSLLDDFNSVEIFNSIFKNDCSSCVVVGSGGNLRQKKLGRLIDSYDIVIRMNSAPIRGYEEDVGKRTTVRISYPEGSSARDELYFDNIHKPLFFSVLFKPQDLTWTMQIARKNTTINERLYWKRVPLLIPSLNISSYFIMNPEFLHLIRKEMGQKARRPTIGTVAIVLALKLCTKVDVAGFGFRPQDKNDYLYYYGNLKIGPKMLYGPHDTNIESAYRESLFKAGLFGDLTDGISNSN